jgi:hypothetical protein
MAVVSISRVRKRVIELLLAAGRGARYADAVADQKRYTVLQELTDAIVEADMLVCMAIIETPGHPYRAGFMTPSTNLATGDFIPAHVGGHGKVEIDNGSGYKGGRLASSREEVLEMIDQPSLYATGGRWYWVEDNEIVHNGSAAKVWYPSFTKTDAACQAHELYTAAVMVNTIPLLRKDGGDPQFYDDFAVMAGLAEARIRRGERTLPDIEQLKVELAALKASSRAAG